MTRPLYIIMRTDMASMTTGRIAAQAAHAQSSFEYGVKQEDNEEVNKLFIDWQNEAGRFGTVIVLNGGSRSDLERLILVDLPAEADRFSNIDYFGEIVIDPEYGVKDGDAVHYLENVPTCAFVFPLGNEWPLLKKLPLL
jgi:hypothetical protein